MEAEHNSSSAVVHVLIIPCPAQGHVNPLLKLAELLALSKFHVTFLNSDYVHHRLLCFSDIETRLSCYPTLRFKTFPDGLPPDHPRSGHQLLDIHGSVYSHAKPHIREVLLSEQLKPKVTCIIGDGFFGGLTADVADELGIPFINFRATSASCFWAFFCIPKVYECHELPIRGVEDMDRMIYGIPGMENLIRCRDLPSYCRASENANQPAILETQQALRAPALILNTFEDLEGPILSHIRLHFPKVYAIGPLHAHLNFRLASKTTSSESPPSSTNNLWPMDRSSLAWLDAQPLKSVVYVSFGSITVLQKEELLEIWYGLVNSKKRFLWAIRPEMVTRTDGEEQVPMELVEGTKERGMMVGWVPQEEVLAHRAIGGFLTHSGWNSTLESVVAGVPMICWPFFGDQQINSRFVGEVWRVGLDMKDACERETVQKMVNDLMVERREEFAKSAEAIATLAKKSVTEGGSSYSNLDRLIDYIKSVSEKN